MAGFQSAGLYANAEHEGQGLRCATPSETTHYSQGGKDLYNRIMEICREIRDFMCSAQVLLASLHQREGFSDVEYETISAVARNIEREVFVYRLEHYKPSSETATRP